MKTVFSLSHPVTYPKTLIAYNTQGDGYIFGTIQILECSVKKMVGTRYQFSGVLVSYAPYFKYEGYLKYSPDRSKLIVVEEKGLNCTLLNPEIINVEHLRYFKQELSIETLDEDINHKRLMLIRKLQAYINETRQDTIRVDVLRSQEFITEDFKNACDYFRIEREMPIIDLFVKKRTQLVSVQNTIRKLKSEQVLRLRDMMMKTPWLLCFKKWSTNLYGLRRLSYLKFKAHIDKYNIQVPMHIYCSIREFENIHKIRSEHGHTLFSTNVIEIQNEELKKQVLDFLIYKGIRFMDVLQTQFCILSDYSNATRILTFIETLEENDTPMVRTSNMRPCIPKSELTLEQHAFLNHLKHPKTHIALLHGGPGTGKSEIGLVALLSHFSNPLIVTYTGMMVDAGQQRMGNRPEVMHTIHYIISISEFVQYSKKWLAAFDLIVFDESSNIDSELLSLILSKISTASKLVMLGDLGQIHPIDPGCPFSDLTDYFDTSTFELTENKRVDEHSRALADASALIARGNVSNINFSSEALTLLSNGSIESRLDTFLTKYCNIIDDIMKIQFVVMRNVDRKMINNYVKRWLVKKGMLSETRTINIARKKLLYKEKITFLKNKKCASTGASVRNGELAQVKSSKINPKLGGSILTLIDGKEVHIHITDGVPPTAIDAGYASTCNKAQGSEWDYVLFLMHDECGSQEWWSRSYPYVAISRAKKNCTIIGTLDNLHKMSQRLQPKRYTVLQYMLSDSAIVKDPIIETPDEIPNISYGLSLMSDEFNAVPRLSDYAPAPKQKQPKKRRKKK